MRKKKQEIKDLCDTQDLNEDTIDDNAEVEFFPATGFWLVGSTEEEPLDLPEPKPEKKT